MYDAHAGFGGVPETGPRIDSRDQLPLEPNQFYQAKIIQYLAGFNGVFKDNTLQGNLVGDTQRTDLLKGIASGRYDVAMQMMLTQEMQPMRGITAEQMRKICTDQVELLRREGHELIKKDRFVDAATDIHNTLEPLRATTNNRPNQTVANGTPIPPLAPAGRLVSDPREHVIDPELETKISLKSFLEAQRLILQTKLSTTPESEIQSRYQANARINLIGRAIATLNSGAPFTQADAPLLMFLINETRMSESARLARAQTKIDNTKEQAVIAASVSKLWQMQKYVEQHQEKPTS